MTAVTATAEAPSADAYEAAFETAVAADERIEPRDWMPDAYRAAPLPALAVFSGVLAKVGAYGFLKIVLPLFPAATAQFQEVVLLIALASILYGSVMAFTQSNVRLIAG